MDRIYFKAAMAAGELTDLLLQVAKNRNYIGQFSYEEADQLKRLIGIIEGMKQELEDIIIEQKEP